MRGRGTVAFTPKGGCPLKPGRRRHHPRGSSASSIHPQGWVPIETRRPSGGTVSPRSIAVAFTPKGGCRLKRVPRRLHLLLRFHRSSIHPQGWVPIETTLPESFPNAGSWACSIHPQGWVPIETSLRHFSPFRGFVSKSSIHPQGWVPIETYQEHT